MEFLVVDDPVFVQELTPTLQTPTDFLGPLGPAPLVELMVAFGAGDPVDDSVPDRVVYDSGEGLARTCDDDVPPWIKRNGSWK